MNHPELLDADGIQWRKSSYSGAGNQCVEVARTVAGYFVRDSKNPEGLWLAVSPAAWDALISDVSRR
jgi:hypothetical protein